MICFFYILLTIFGLILADPPKLDEIKSSRTINNGSKFSILCTILTGTKPFQFEWRFNDELLPNPSTDYRIDSIDDEQSLFIIPHVKPINSGQYSCIVRNDYGYDRQSTRLMVTGLHFHLPTMCGAYLHYLKIY
uniref:Hemicentin-1-like n=1 Tax=Dermatophagoides pteronyssinus TaxID=6956 RepID=A0A6P6Y2B0_DERPT|nr:hemicentin-1-like [Dermatophagoides pteronyssinus]